MQALFINAAENCVTLVHLPSEVAAFNTEVNRLLQCTSHIYSIAKDKATKLIVDEECLTNETNVAFLAPFMKRPLFGNALLIGRDPATGNTIDLPAGYNPITIPITFFSREQTSQYRLEAVEFAISVRNKRR